MVGASQIALIDGTIFLPPLVEFEEAVLLRDVWHAAKNGVTYETGVSNMQSNVDTAVSIREVLARSVKGWLRECKLTSWARQLLYTRRQVLSAVGYGFDDEYDAKNHSNSQQ